MLCMASARRRACVGAGGAHPETGPRGAYRAGALVVLAALLLAPLSFVRAEGSDGSPVSTEVRRLIRDELQGQVALDHVWQLSTWDRTSTTEGFHQAVEYVRAEAAKVGLEDIEVIRYPADGKSPILDTYTASWAWRLGGGSLAYADSGEPVCRYLDVPTCIVKYASGLDAVAELVDVGTGLDEAEWAGKDVDGKLVLASSTASSVYGFAEGRFDILGVVSHWGNYLPDRSPFPDQVAWQAVPQSLEPRRSAFSISKRMAAELLRRLERGPVRLHARIDAELEEGEYEVLSAAIPGTDLGEEEVLVIAHLNHHRPGANDNASGSGLSLEVAKVLRSLIDRDLLAPRRTIRFLWVPEHRGTQIFLHLDREWNRRGIAVINNDMVGADQAESGSIFQLTRTPGFRPSYLPDLLRSLLEEVAREQYRSRWGSRNPFHFEEVAYSGVISDHAHFVDSTVAVPAVMLGTFPDNFYHSNEDTADHVDATTLMRAGYVTASTAAFLADAGARDTVSLAQLVWGGSSARFSTALATALNRVVAATDLDGVWRVEDNRLRHMAGYAVESVGSVRRLGTSPAAERRLSGLEEALRRQATGGRRMLRRAYVDEAALRGLPAEPEGDSTATAAGSRVPLRTFFGTLRFAFVLERLPESRRAWYEQEGLDAMRRDAILNYADGRRTAAEIRDAVAADLGAVELAGVLRFLEDLVFVDLMQWRD